jgi:site-specific DNA-cytosine methylase
MGIDTLTGGVPCVGYSKAGLQRGKNDPRDGIEGYLAAITLCRPLTIEMENVANLIKHEEVLQDLLGRLANLGYHCEVHVPDMSAYGVPQYRKRLIILGSLFGPIAPPVPPGGHPQTLRDAIGEGTRFDAFNNAPAALVLTPAQLEKCESLDRMSGSKPRHLRTNEPARTVTSSNIGSAPGDLLRIRLNDGSIVDSPWRRLPRYRLFRTTIRSKESETWQPGGWWVMRTRLPLPPCCHDVIASISIRFGLPVENLREK